MLLFVIDCAIPFAGGYCMFICILKKRFFRSIMNLLTGTFILILVIVLFYCAHSPAKSAVGIESIQGKFEDRYNITCVHSISFVTSFSTNGESRTIQTEEWYKVPDKYKGKEGEKMIIRSGHNMFRYNNKTKEYKEMIGNAKVISLKPERFTMQYHLKLLKDGHGVYTKKDTRGHLFDGEQNQILRNCSVTEVLITNKYDGRLMKFHVCEYYDNKTDLVYAIVEERLDPDDNEVMGKTITLFDFPVNINDDTFTLTDTDKGL